MRVDSAMPRYQTRLVLKNDEIQKQTVSGTVPISESLYSVNKNSGILITFTGKDKNIHQVASYAPENKRYGIKQYNLGGLGVVAQEAPNSWRTREGLDVRDFSPYHSFGNDDGGIRVVKLAKDEDGRYLSAYKISDFVTAKHNESLDDLRTRLNIPKEQKLAFVIQQPANEKGVSKIVRLEDTGISGSVVRPGTESVMTAETIPYRMFRAVDIHDPITLATDKYKQKIFDEIEKPYREPIEAEVNAQFAEELKKAKEEDKALFEEKLKQFEYLEKQNPHLQSERPTLLPQKQKNIEKKIKAEIKKRLNADDVRTKIESEYQTRLNSEEVKNALLKITEHAASDVPERNSVYFIYTKGLAQFENAYGAGNSAYGAYGAYGSYGTYGTTGKNGIRAVSTNVMYADNCRALADAMPKLNTPEHGNYNPASWWLHDRPAFIAINEIANLSASGNEYYTGLKIHGTFHNPGRDYQGAESNPFEFYRMVATKEDIRELNAHPQAEQLRDIESRWATATPEERRFANQILRPFMENFLDDFVDEATDTRTFNISMTPVAGVKINPENLSAGTVSMNYGKEMKSPNTPDIAQYMTNKLAEIHTVDITNGSTPANLRLNDPTADFCQKDELNGITMLKNGMTYEKDGKKIVVSGFTPYEYRQVIQDGKVLDNIDEVLNAKKANTKWFLDAIGDAFKRGGNSAVTKMFFSDEQIKKKNASVIGYLSEYKEGDMLFMGWGRPDPQKGYPSTFQAFLDFLKNPDVPKEVKQHTKLVVGAGVWDEGARDYKWIKDIIRQIEEYDGGIYRGNACYVNGFFPNRLVGCATYSIFTSRFEPCGITPLESFAAGTPVISTNTGGAPDFISATRGYLTNNPYLRSPEHLGVSEGLARLSGNEYAETLDSIRMHTNAKEVSGCIEAAVSDYPVNKYREMVRDAITQKIDWHENADYNGGKSANERYLGEELFNISGGVESRQHFSLKRLVSKYGQADALVEDAKKAKDKWTKTIIAIGIGVAAIGTATYLYINKKNKKHSVNNIENKLNKVA